MVFIIITVKFCRELNLNSHDNCVFSTSRCQLYISKKLLNTLKQSPNEAVVTLERGKSFYESVLLTTFEKKARCLQDPCISPSRVSLAGDKNS